MGIVRKVWKQGHVIRKKKYFGENAGYLANTNLILRALRKDKTKFSADSQFALTLRTAQRQNRALAGGFPLLLLKEERFPLRGFLRGFIL